MRLVMTLFAPALCLAPLTLGACGNPRAAAPAPAPPSPAAEYDHRVATAASLVELGRLDRAEELCAEAVKSAPERSEAYVVWGRALASESRLGEAALQYEQARARGSRDRRLFVELTSVYDVAKAYDKSIEVYRDWLAKTPADGEMHQELGLTYLLLERFGEAAASLREAARLLPDDLQVRQDLGYALLRAQDLAGASVELEAVLNADPRRTEALRYLAQTRAAQGRVTDALALLDRALGLAPGEPRALRVRGRLRALGGDATGALDDYQALLASKADDAPALLGAAGALLALERPSAAAPLVARARTALGDVPDVRFREAQLAWRNGDRKALATLRTLADGWPTPVEIWRELALAAKKLGDKKLAAEARQHLDGGH
jgi:tetratricopeptide (TPR) repeat protein